jgi:hypothetical protein
MHRDVQFFNLSWLHILIPVFWHFMTGAGGPGCLHLHGKSASLTVCLLCRLLSAQSCCLSLSEVDTLLCIAVLLLLFYTFLETNRQFTLKVVSSVEWDWRNWLQCFLSHSSVQAVPPELCMSQPMGCQLSVLGVCFLFCLCFVGIFLHLLS